MIVSFGDRLAASLFDDRRSKDVRRFPVELHRIARRKLLYLHDAAALTDLAVPPGNRLERLRGERAGYYSIRINDQWRVVFRWEAGNALDVQVVDYHG
jgi:proteic killer suppression protein